MKTPSPAQALRKAKHTKWEDLLEFHLQQYGLATLFQREYVIAELGRKWRWDFADPINRVALEFQGAIWVANRGHSGGSGIQRDHAKLNAAQLHGWTVFHFDDKAVRSLAAIDLVRNYYARWVYQMPDKCTPVDIAPTQ